MSGAEEEKSSLPRKPMAFVPPKPPVLQPNIAALLKEKTPPPPPPASFQPIANPFAPVKKPVSPLPVPREPQVEVKIENTVEVEPKKKMPDALPLPAVTEIPITPIVESKQITSPATVDVTRQEEVKNEVKKPADVFNDKIDMSGGLVSWFTKTVAESKFMNEVAEKAKAGMETVMTTLDPGMKPFLAEHGVIELAIFDCDADVVSIAHRAFSKAGALVIARGLPGVEEKSSSPLVLGDLRARQACSAKLEAAKKARKSGDEVAAIVTLQPFLIDISGRMYSTTKILLKSGNLEIDTIGQLIEVDKKVVEVLEKSVTKTGEYEISVADAAKAIFNHSNASETWTSSGPPPYSSAELLEYAFVSLAQQLLSNLEKK